MWTCISLMQARVFCFFAGGSRILNSNRYMWQWKEEATLCEIHMRDFKSHFWWYFLANCARPVSVHLAMACVCCLFTSFSIFFAQCKTTTKSHENYVFLYPFSSMAISPPNNEKNIFYTGKLYSAIQAGLLTPLTFAWHRLSPLAAFTSCAYFLHNGRRWQWICEFYTANFKGIFGGP